MSEPHLTSSDADDDRRFAQRIQAEIAVDAERRRREDPELPRLEREIDRAWAHVAPPGAVGTAEELLLDRVGRLSMIDVDAPLGSKPGVKQVKGAIRKGTYWYLRYMSDQLNALHSVQARALRRMDERLTAVEISSGVDRAVDALVATPSAPGAEVGRLVADRLGEAEGTVVVIACGAGACVAALTEAGGHAYGVDAAPGAVLTGIDQGLDLRVADPTTHLVGLDTDSLAAVVLGGEVQRVTVADALKTVAAAVRVCVPGGLVVIVPEPIKGRSVVEADLLDGRGLEPETWAHILAASGAATEVVPVEDLPHTAAVVARLP